MDAEDDNDRSTEAMLPRKSLKPAAKSAVLTDWCVMERIRYDVKRFGVIRCPEDRIGYYQRRGWSLLARDSEFPVPLMEYPKFSEPVRNADPGDERPPDYGEA